MTVVRLVSKHLPADKLRTLFAADIVIECISIARHILVVGVFQYQARNRLFV